MTDVQNNIANSFDKKSTSAHVAGDFAGEIGDSRNSKIIDDSNPNLSLENLSPVRIDTQCEFVVGGVNPSERIRSLTTIADRPISEIELFMRSKEYLQNKESLIDVLANDNDTVLGRGLSHQLLASSLRGIISAALYQGLDGELGTIVQVGDATCEVSRIGYRGYFQPAFQTSYNNKCVAYSSEFALKKSVTQPTGLVSTVTSTQTIRLFGTVLEMIDSHGFYGGHTSFRIDPLAIIEFLDMKGDR
jgi:hypothetical protein